VDSVIPPHLPKGQWLGSLSVFRTHFTELNALWTFFTKASLEQTSPRLSIGLDRTK